MSAATMQFPRLSAERLRPRELRDAVSDIGGAIIEGVFPQEDVQRPLRAWCDVIRAYLAEHGDPAAHLTDPEQLHDALARLDPDAAQVALGLGRDLPDYLHLISDPRLRALVTAATGSPHHQLAFDHCLLRVDRPGSDATNFDWHQDYSYNVLSTDAVTFWIPLVPITADMGPLSVVPRSHGEILPIRVEPGAQKFDPNRLPLAVPPETIAEWEASRVELAPMAPGSVLLFSCLLLHRSGPNRGARSRFVANGRYGRFDDRALIRRNWYTARIKYPFYFTTAHPDLVRTQETP